PPARVRPALEALEDRLTPSTMLAPQNGPGLLPTTGATFTSSSQSFTVVNGQLIIDGDQLGYGYADTISIDVNGHGGVYVNLNGQIAGFDPGQITSIVVNTKAGSNSVYVLNEAEGVTLTINNGGSDYISIGSHGSVQGILGSVSINSPSYYT